MQTTRAETIDGKRNIERKGAPNVPPPTVPLAPIYPYEAPRQFASDLWQIRGSLSIPVLPRYMTVYRLPDGKLLLYSVIAMHDEGMRALEAMGTPAIMVMPHDRHQMDAPFYKQRYPDLRVLAPAPSSARRVPVDADLDALTALRICAYPLPGATYHEVILELPIDGGVALCTCELLGNGFSTRGFLGLLMKLLGPPGGGFGVNRAVRWREVDDRNKVRRWLRGLAERTDIKMILLGHGAAVTANIPAALRRAAEES